MSYKKNLEIFCTEGLERTKLIKEAVSLIDEDLKSINKFATSITLEGEDIVVKTVALRIDLSLKDLLRKVNSNWNVETVAKEIVDEISKELFAKDIL